jgi:hypothetical protein
MAREETEKNRRGDEKLFLKESIFDIRQQYNHLAELYLFGEIDGDTYINKLSETVYFDAEGNPWVISPFNGNWYLAAGDTPVLAEPPPVLMRPAELKEDQGAGQAEESGGKFCSSCGKPLREEARFCASCGKPV